MRLRAGLGAEAGVFAAFDAGFFGVGSSASAGCAACEKLFGSARLPADGGVAAEAEAVPAPLAGLRPDGGHSTTERGSAGPSKQTCCRGCASCDDGQHPVQRSLIRLTLVRKCCMMGMAGFGGLLHEGLRLQNPVLQARTWGSAA